MKEALKSSPSFSSLSSCFSSSFPFLVFLPILFHVFLHPTFPSFFLPISLPLFFSSSPSIPLLPFDSSQEMSRCALTYDPTTMCCYVSGTKTMLSMDQTSRPQKLLAKIHLSSFLLFIWAVITPTARWLAQVHCSTRTFILKGHYHWIQNYSVTIVFVLASSRGYPLSYDLHGFL